MAGTSHEGDGLLPSPSLWGAACLPLPSRCSSCLAAPCSSARAFPSSPWQPGPGGHSAPPACLLCPPWRAVRGWWADTGWMRRESSTQPRAGEASGAPVGPGCMRWGAALLPVSVRSWAASQEPWWPGASSSSREGAQGWEGGGVWPLHFPVTHLPPEQPQGCL